MKLTSEQKGSLALVLMAFGGSIMGIWVRYLGDHFELYQQVSARAFAAFLIGLIILRNRIKIKNILSAPKRDLIILFFRSMSTITAIGLFTFAMLNAKYANVMLIYALPTTALLGVIILKEKLTKEKFGLILIGFLGVVLIAIKDFSNLGDFGKGELIAFISAFFYSTSYIIRRLLSNKLKDEEITQIGSMFSFIFAFIVSQLFGNGIDEFTTTTPFLGLIIFCAGITFITIALSGNYGFGKVEAIIAGNIVLLESVFGIFVGLIVYSEVPTIKEFIGGAIIIFSAVMMNRLQNKKMKSASLKEQ